MAPSSTTFVFDHDRSRRPRKRMVTFVRWVRRIHLYSGLLLFPWALLFGVSGFLFNHPTLGDGLDEREADTATLRKVTSWQPLDAAAVARDVVDGIATRSSEPYELDASFPPHVYGWALFSAPGGTSKFTAAVDVVNGHAVVTTRPEAVPAKTAPFAGLAVDPGAVSLDAMASDIEGLLPGLGLDAAEPLRAHPKIGPSVRFRVTDSSGRLFNVAYDLRHGAVQGRAVDTPSGYDLKSYLSRMHMTHHYPVQRNAGWWWALAADGLALTLVFWALSGLVMWWQMRALRRTGAIAVAVALVLGGVSFLSVAEEIGFLGAAGGRGPGESSPASQPTKKPTPPPESNDGDDGLARTNRGHEPAAGKS